MWTVEDDSDKEDGTFMMSGQAGNDRECACLLTPGYRMADYGFKFLRSGLARVAQIYFMVPSGFGNVILVFRLCDESL